MSKNKKEIYELTDLEIVHILEKKFSRDLSHIVYSHTERDGTRVFDCLDIGAEATLTIGLDGYVVVKAAESKFSDILGTIY